MRNCAKCAPRTPCCVLYCVHSTWCSCLAKSCFQKMLQASEWWSLLQSPWSDRVAKKESERGKSTKVKQEHLYWAVHGQLLSRCSWDTQEISGDSDVETSRHRFNAEDKMHGVDSINARWWNSSVSSLAFIFAVIPTIQHGPQVFSTIEGTPISLPCRAAGVPAPDITWTKVCISSLETAKKKKNARSL